MEKNIRLFKVTVKSKFNMLSTVLSITNARRKCKVMQAILSAREIIDNRHVSC